MLALDECAAGGWRRAWLPQLTGDQGAADPAQVLAARRSGSVTLLLLYAAGPPTREACLGGERAACGAGSPQPGLHLSYRKPFSYSTLRDSGEVCR